MKKVNLGLGLEAVQKESGYAEVNGRLTFNLSAAQKLVALLEEIAEKKKLTMSEAAKKKLLAKWAKEVGKS